MVFSDNYGEIRPHKILRFGNGLPVEMEDCVVVEEPLEIHVEGRPQAVLMRTPGDDFDLVAGFMHTERILVSPADIASLHYGDPAEFNLVNVRLAPGTLLPEEQPRTFPVTAACGICGKTVIDAIRADLSGLGENEGESASGFFSETNKPQVHVENLVRFPALLRSAQRVFAQTGGLHAAGLFTSEGELLCIREDIGRHNAVDKIVGSLARNGQLPASSCVLQVSGRAGFDIVQKAIVAGIPVLSSVSAPSSLALDLAEEAGMTLVGFVREGRCNVYTCPDRLVW